MEKFLCRLAIARFFCLFFILLSLFFFLPVGVADSFDDDLQTWQMLTMRANVGKRFQLYVEGQSRLKENSSKLDRILLRPALGYQLTPTFSIWQGYAFTPGFNPNASEHRLFQQVLWEKSYDKVQLSNRFRFEERFIEQTSDVSLRARNLLRVSRRLGQQKKWSVVVYDECFWNVNNLSVGPKSGFDQNRIFLGLNRRLSKQTNLEAGYMLNLLNRQAPQLDRLNHILLLTLNIRI